MLDPASASIAFVGFTASLVTLVAATTNSAQSVHDLWKSIGNTPKEVKALLRQLRRLEDLVHCLQNCNFSNAPLSRSIAAQWEDSTKEIECDMREVHELVLKLHRLLSKPTTLQKVQARLRYVLAENTILRYQQRLQYHCGQLTLMLSVVS